MQDDIPTQKHSWGNIEICSLHGDEKARENEYAHSVKGFELGGAIPPPLLGNKLIVAKLLSSKNTEELEFND